MKQLSHIKISSFNSPNNISYTRLYLPHLTLFSPLLQNGTVPSPCLPRCCSQPQVPVTSRRVVDRERRAWIYAHQRHKKSAPSARSGGSKCVGILKDENDTREKRKWGRWKEKNDLKIIITLITFFFLCYASCNQEYGFFIV